MSPGLFPIAVAGILSAAPVLAGERRVELVPMIGVRGGASMDSGVPGIPPAKADPAVSFGLGVDVFVRPDGWFETFLDHQTLHFSSDPGAFGTSAFDFKIDYLEFGGGYEPPEGRVRPFVTAALGVTRYAASAASVSSSLALSGSIAGGVRVPVGKSVALRFELRGYGTAGSTVVSASYGPGFTLQYGTSGWYQLAFRAGLAIRI